MSYLNHIVKKLQTIVAMAVVEWYLWRRQPTAWLAESRWRCVEARVPNKYYYYCSVLFSLLDCKQSRSWCMPGVVEEDYVIRIGDLRMIIRLCNVCSVGL